MVTDQEPRYRLVDADGNVVGSLFAESDGTLKLQEGTSGNDNELSLTTQGALNVEQTDVTNETFIRAKRSESNTGISAGSFVNVVNFEAVDLRGEFNSSQQIVVDETSEYSFTVYARFAGGTDGDTISVRLQNVDAGTTVAGRFDGSVSGSSGTVVVSFTRELTAGTSYEVQGANQNSQYEIFDGEIQCDKSLIQP